jgi:hypothetical protein
VTKRKFRARPSTVERWLEEGIPERTFNRLVDELAPSASTARRWQRDEVIPERVLRAIKPPRPPAAARPKPRARPAPERRRPVAKAPPARPVREPPRPKRPKRPKAEAPPRFPGWKPVRPPEPPEIEVEEEEWEEAPPPRRPPRRAETVLTREQIAGMKSLGLSADQISAAGREETQEERDARMEREAIATEGAAPPKPVTPLELEQARELMRLRAELEQAKRVLEEPPAMVHPLGVPFHFDVEPRKGESDDHWFERISEEIIAEARIDRLRESPPQRADRLVNQIRQTLRDKMEAEALMDNVATEIAMETGENIRDIFRTFFSPGWRGAA